MRIEVMPGGQLRLTKNGVVIVLEKSEVSQVVFLAGVTLQEESLGWTA